MQLAQFQLTNFRSCAQTAVSFHPDLTVLIGENGSGKSAIIDALRLSTTAALENRSFWFDPARDTTFADEGKPVVLTTRYTALAEEEKAVFLAQVVDAHGDLVLNTTFTPRPSSPTRASIQLSVGDEVLADPEPILRERVAHVYLPPLRDAVREIGAGDGTRLAEVLQVLSTDGTDEFREQANSYVAQIAELALPKEVREKVQDELRQLTHPARKHEAYIGGRDHELRRLAGLLRIQMSEAGVKSADIASAGLGYANLLYIAMIVVQLSKAQDHDLTLLLVEEPEAHLHPQLQMVLLEYLQRRAKESRGRPRVGLRPAGRVQVVVSTHSPNLASSVSTKNIVVVSRQATVGDAWSTKTRALLDTKIKEIDRRKIDRYLSVTRASLLFARQVILVEGIADSLVIPAIARHIVLKDDPLALRQLTSATIVPIDGVDFKPYVKMLLGGDIPLVDKLVVVTDGDEKNLATPGAARKAKLEEKWGDDVASGRFVVCAGTYTLEADLFGPVENADLLRAAYLKMYPKSAKKWDAIGGDTAKARAKAFRKAMEAKNFDLGKGDFAQIVAEALELSPDGFKVPDYIDEAIRAVLMDIASVEDEILPVEELDDHE